MASVKKQALYPSTFVASTPDGQRVAVSFTPEKIRHYKQRMREMIDHGYQVPVCWEHQSVAKPMTQAEYQRMKARETRELFLGYMTGAELTNDNSLDLTFEVEDPADVSKVKRIRYTSPEIVRDFVDGTGRLWPGESITHLAVTTRPVQGSRQRPFQLIHMALGGPQTIRLSIAEDIMADDYEDDDKESPDDDFDDMDDMDDDETSDVTDETPDVDVAEPSTEIPIETPEMPALPDMQLKKKMADILNILQSQYNVAVAPQAVEGDPGTFLDHLHTALATATLHKQGDALEQPEEEQPMQPDPNQQVQEVPTSPLMMSLQAQNESLKYELENMKRLRLEDQKSRIERRILRIEKANADIGKKLRSEFGTVQLSLGSDGQVTNPALLAKLEAYEAVLFNQKEKVKSKLANSVQLSLPKGVNEVPNPEETTDEKANEDIAARLTGGKSRRTAKV